MEVKLQKESMGFYKKILDASMNHEETMEMIVPDTLPDVLDIVDTDGTAVLRSKEADNGKLSVSGVVRTYIIYVPEGGKGVRSLPVQLPFSMTIDAADVKPSTRLVVKADLAGVDARIINSRKLIVRADIILAISAYADSVLSVSGGLEDGGGLEVLKTNCELNPIVDVTEKTFSFSDTLTLPSSKPPIGALLKSSAHLTADDVKTVGSKLIVKGTAYISLIYSASGNGELNASEFNLPFSQIMELPGEGDFMSFHVNLMPTGIYIQESGDMTGTHGLSAELAAVAQLIVWKKTTVSYLSDVYSTAYETESVLGDHAVHSLISSQIIRETVRETISTPSPVRSVIGVRVYPGKVKQDTDGFKSSLNASVLCVSEEGKLMRVADRFEFSVNHEIDDSAELNGIMQLSDVFASPGAGGVELRIPVELCIRAYENIEVSSVAEVNLNEDQANETAGMPSLVLCRVGEKDTMWSLAKRYHSTRDLIRQANALEETDDVKPNELLIIAKKR